VPDQLAIVGVNNDELTCDHALTPLSSVDMNLEAMGCRTAGMLDALMDGPPIAEVPTLIRPHRFVTPHSSDLIAADREHVTEALHVIADRHTDANLTRGHDRRGTAQPRRVRRDGADPVAIAERAAGKRTAHR
jgi:hypothetical protein